MHKNNSNSDYSSSESSSDENTRGKKFEGIDPRPQGFQNDGAGRLWCAIAETPHGRIPGKAKGYECWYPYGGKEHHTKNFTIVIDQRRRPKILNHKVHPPQGKQNDGTGDFWCAVAYTEHGRIPGKANAKGQCWYPYGGKEHMTENFRYIVPAPQGVQYDGAGRFYAAIAHTAHGKIPGKAKGNDCWYPYGGKEHHTHDFQLVFDQVPSNKPNGSAHGHQNDVTGKFWCAIAKSWHGLIPGKAKDGTCWFPYAGKEHTTKDFYYLCIE